jgi:hypothetical protein
VGIPGSLGWRHLSLNASVANQWSIGAALGVFAVFLRELAAPYALVCGLLSFRARRWRESVLWVIGGVAYAVYYVIHAMAASAAIQPGDLSRHDSYIRWLGLSFVVKTLYLNGLLTPLPPVITSIASGVGLAAVWARSAPDQLKVSLLLYFVLFCIVGHPFDYYWDTLPARFVGTHSSTAPKEFGTWPPPPCSRRGIRGRALMSRKGACIAVARRWDRAA